MANYLNPGTDAFQMALKSRIFVDKSELLTVINQYVRTLQRFICVSRPRRFGKSTAADMLAAYYDRSVDTENMFDNLKISRAESYKEHLNQYDVIKINMQEFLSISQNIDDMLFRLKEYLLFDLLDKYEMVRFRDKKNLIQVMKDMFAFTKTPFVILIDEWDCLFREYKQDNDFQKKYLDFLRA